MKDPQQRGLWLAMAAVVGVLAGTAGAVLAYLAGNHPAQAAITGAGAGAATLTLAIMALTFLGG